MHPGKITCGRSITVAGLQKDVVGWLLPLRDDLGPGRSMMVLA